MLVQGRARARPSKFVVFVPAGAELASSARIESELRAYTAVEEHLYARCSAAARRPEQQSSSASAARQAALALALPQANNGNGADTPTATDTWVYRPREGYEIGRAHV